MNRDMAGPAESAQIRRIERRAAGMKRHLVVDFLRHRAAIPAPMIVAGQDRGPRAPPRRPRQRPLPPAVIHQAAMPTYRKPPRRRFRNRVSPPQANSRAAAASSRAALFRSRFAIHVLP